jgi:CBS domain-containing protein
MLVKEIMTPNAEHIAPDTTVKQAAGKMRDLDVGFLPIGDNDRLIGMLTDRDITLRMVADGKDPEKTNVSDIMTNKVEFCFDDQEIGEAGEHMKADKIRRLVVLNRDKRMVGICSLGDIAMNSEGNKLAGDVLNEVTTTSKQTK